MPYPPLDFRNFTRAMNRSQRQQHLQAPWGQCALWWSVLLLVKALTGIFFSQIPNILSAFWYPFLHRLTQWICGSFSNSIGDMLYAIVLIYILVRLLLLRHFTWSWPRVLTRIAQVYGLFWLCWGFQYDRQPLLSTPDVQSQSTYEQQLLHLTQQLIEQTNTQWVLAHQHPIDFKSLEGQNWVFEQARRAVGTWPKVWCALPNDTSLMLKSSSFSQGLSCMGFGGYLNPFTHESQVNMHQPQVLIPAVACHELAHQQGVASEAMCNYMGYWATQHSSQPVVAYSGSLMMLRYALAGVHATRPRLYQKLRARLCDGIQKDLLNIKSYWQQHQNPAQAFFNSMYDHFLQWNHQPKGIEAYGECVQLLVKYPVTYKSTAQLTRI